MTATGLCSMTGETFRRSYSSALFRSVMSTAAQTIPAIPSGPRSGSTVRSKIRVSPPSGVRESSSRAPSPVSITRFLRAASLSVSSRRGKTSRSVRPRTRSAVMPLIGLRTQV
jgi:hypothetical protein